MMTLETLRVLSEAVRTLGLVAVGGWAVYLFHRLQRLRRAEMAVNLGTARLQRAQLQIDTEKYRRLREQPALSIKLRVQETVTRTTPFCAVLGVTVVLENDGDFNLDVSFDDSSLTVGRIVEDECHEQTIQGLRHLFHWYLAPGRQAPGAVPKPRIFRIGQSRTIPFALEIEVAGTYLVQFRAAYKARCFDEERQLNKEPLTIDAFEQTIYVVTAGRQEAPAHTP